MNAAFLKDALEIIDNLTPEEIATGLKEHGIEFASVYSGKKLSEVPYDDIYIGMDLISNVGSPGKVVEKIPKEKLTHRENDNWIVIDWINGKQSQQLHCFLDKVTVK